ncbi:MAG: hypothetical protein AAGA48_12920 [Myxococcota bacterium]
MSRALWMGALVIVVIVGFGALRFGSSTEEGPQDAAQPTTPAPAAVARPPRASDNPDLARRYDHARGYAETAKTPAPERPEVEPQAWSISTSVADESWRKRSQLAAREAARIAAPHKVEEIQKIAWDFVNTVIDARQDVANGDLDPVAFRLSVRKIQENTQKELTEVIGDPVLSKRVWQSINASSYPVP